MKFIRFVCSWLAMLLPLSLLADAPPMAKSAGLSNTVILIIRHAEKPDDGSGLSTEGEARAQAYVNYFKTFTLDGQPLKLNCLFAAADSKESRRPRLTLEPMSQALGLPVDLRFKNKNFQDLADELKSQPHGHAILIAWHHEKIPALLRALGADSAQVFPKDKWPDSVFGWVIQLRYDADGKLIEAKRIEEKLMPDDLK
jgi:hypothetical protein